MKSALYVTLAYGREEAAQILANKGAQCTEAEIRMLGDKYTQFSGKRAAQASLQEQWQGARQPIQGKERPGQEQDSLGNNENATGTKVQEEGKEEQEIRKKGGFVFQSSPSKEGRGR